ncbi:MAG: hypothetical protein V4599_01745 [Verrucomicrobiota bacterium]
MKGPATDVARGFTFRVPPRTDAAFCGTYEKVNKTVTLKPAS